MYRRPPCPTDEYLEAIAQARLILPPDVHLQAPPNLSDDFGVLLDAGIDDWGGVSPVTADHVNPERPWPDLERLRQVTEADHKVLAPRLTLYPEFVLRPDRWVHPDLRFAVADRSDAEGLGHDDPGSVFVRRRPPPSSPASRCSTSARSTAWYSGPRWSRLLVPVGPRPVARWARCWPAWSGRRSGSTRSSPCSRPGVPRWRRWPRWPTTCAARWWATSSPSSTTATSTTRTSARSSAASAASPRARSRSTSGHALPAHARRHRGPGGRGRRSGRHRGLPPGRHPSQLRRRLLHRRDQGREGGRARHARHGFTALEVTEGARRLGEPLAYYLTRLRDAGLRTLPGTAAEILDDEIRELLCPDKIDTDEWLEAHRAAHSVG